MAERPSDLLPPRWYILDKDGEAMLCRDEADAIAEAVRNDQRFPKRGPHVAAQLAPVRTLDAAPSEPSAECWRRAVEQWKAKHGWYVGDRLQAVCEVEALAREIAREAK